MMHFIVLHPDTEETAPDIKCPLQRIILTAVLLFQSQILIQMLVLLIEALDLFTKKIETGSVNCLNAIPQQPALGTCRATLCFFHGNLSRRGGRRRMSTNIGKDLATRSAGKTWHGRIKYFQYLWCSNSYFLL